MSFEDIDLSGILELISVSLWLSGWSWELDSYMQHFGSHERKKTCVPTMEAALFSKYKCCITNNLKVKSEVGQGEPSPKTSRASVHFRVQFIDESMSLRTHF